MAKQITDRCTMCGVCLPECPNEGIIELDGRYAIDASLCTECFGFRDAPGCESVCPVDAIEDMPGTPEDDAEIAGRAALLRPDHFPRD